MFCFYFKSDNFVSGFELGVEVDIFEDAYNLVFLHFMLYFSCWCPRLKYLGLFLDLSSYLKWRWGMTKRSTWLGFIS